MHYVVITLTEIPAARRFYHNDQTRHSSADTQDKRIYDAPATRPLVICGGARKTDSDLEWRTELRYTQLLFMIKLLTTLLHCRVSHAHCCMLQHGQLLLRTQIVVLQLSERLKARLPFQIEMCTLEPCGESLIGLDLWSALS